MMKSWLDRLIVARPPAGYWPGATLARLGRNLGRTDFSLLEPTLAEFTLQPGGWQLQVRERVESHLLMHIVFCEFHLCIPAQYQDGLKMVLRHSGALRRTGVSCVYKAGDKAHFKQVRARLLGCAALLEALMPLDFKHLTLECRDGHWWVVLEHMGGSEVVNRMPSFRRYIQISAEQRAHLWQSFDALAGALQQV